MHFIINKNSLIHALSHVSKAVSLKNTIPILTGIKFDLNEEGLKLTGTDSDITIQMVIPIKADDKELVQIIDYGEIILPKYIVDIVRKLPNDEIEFKLIDRLTVVIKSGLSEFCINGFDVEDYPELLITTDSRSFNIDSNLLKTMIKQTIFAISFNESRPILNGVLWNLDGEVLKFIATDSHRLAIREAVIDNNSNISLANVVVPGKSLNELYKVLDDYDTLVDLTVTDNQVFIRINNLIFISRLLDGTYPDISRIIPKEGSTNMIINNTELLDSIERASLIAKESKNNIVKLITVEDEMIEISSNLQEIGKVTELVRITDFKGEAIKISFNSKYVIDALKIIDSKEISIEFTGELSPFVIKPKDHNKMLHLILPIRTY